jgi:SAM-dependent methyltransferase
MEGTMLLEAVLELPFGALIDMGCGDGEFLVELGRRRPEAEYFGVDVDEQALATAQRRFAGLPGMRIRLLREDCRHTSLTADVADAAVYRMLLHHILQVGDALMEARRIVRPGGALITREGSRLAEADYLAMNAQVGRQGLPIDAHPGFAPGELVVTLGTYGFRLERLMDGGTATFATPPYTDRVYATPAFILVARRTA